MERLNFPLVRVTAALNVGANQCVPRLSCKLMFVCGVESEQVKPRLERMFDVDTSPVYSWLCAWGGGGGTLNESTSDSLCSVMKKEVKTSSAETGLLSTSCTTPPHTHPLCGLSVYVSFYSAFSAPPHPAL